MWYAHLLRIQIEILWGGYMRLVRNMEFIFSLYMSDFHEYILWRLFIFIMIRKKGINYQRGLLLRVRECLEEWFVCVCIYIYSLNYNNTGHAVCMSFISFSLFFWICFLKFGWKLCLVQIHSYSFFKFN